MDGIHTNCPRDLGSYNKNQDLKGFLQGKNALLKSRMNFSRDKYIPPKKKKKKQVIERFMYPKEKDAKIFNSLDNTPNKRPIPLRVTCFSTGERKSFLQTKGLLEDAEGMVSTTLLRNELLMTQKNFLRAICAPIREVLFSKFKRKTIKDGPSSCDIIEERDPDTYMIGTIPIPLGCSTTYLKLP